MGPPVCRRRGCWRTQRTLSGRNTAGRWTHDNSAALAIVDTQQTQLKGDIGESSLILKSAVVFCLNECCKKHYFLTTHFLSINDDVYSTTHNNLHNRLDFMLRTKWMKSLSSLSNKRTK